MVVILRCCLSSSSSSSVSFIIQRRDDEKRERERVICLNTKEMRENSFKEVWPFFLFFSFSLQLFFKATDEFALNFFSRKNLLSQTTEQF